MNPCANNCGDCPYWIAGCKKGFHDIGDCAFIGVDGYYDTALYEDTIDVQIGETEEFTAPEEDIVEDL